MFSLSRSKSLVASYGVPLRASVLNVRIPSAVALSYIILTMVCSEKSYLVLMAVFSSNPNSFKYYYVLETISSGSICSS